MLQKTTGQKQKTLMCFLLALAFIFLAPTTPLTAAPDDSRMSELRNEAQKEGKVVFYTSFVLQDAMTFVDRFQKKYPFIKVELIRLSNTQIFNRMLTEQRAKKTSADVITCKGDAMHMIQKVGLLDKYVSPERRFYADGFKDKEGFWTDVYPTVHSVVYNTRLVPATEAPTSYQDLLKPRWKGKIGINPNNYMWAEALMQIMGREAALKYLEALARQNPIYRDGGTLNIILTAAGEVAMAVSVNANLVEKEKVKGAPVEWARIKPYFGDLHPIALVNRAPHPSAGKLFIDFFLSQEGQELMVQLGNVPARKGLKSRIVNSEEITPLDPALGERLEYYQKLMKQLFSKNS